uniref:NADH dehydrogenase subunit 6 n=1 Tax=Posthodiplostomum centrarchi TaxID=1954244 RepID=A0A6J3YQE3_9TREM|nr:NADH dehydrogenase subunit 6 [Posthodiplostomum centrarchi]
MSLLAFFLALYSAAVISFSFISNPVFYCLFLLVGSLASCGIIYIVMGFSWYMLLFCVVYVGGVYIMFIFVTVYQPNSVVSSNISSWWVFFFTTVVVLTFSWSFSFFSGVFFENSNFLCNSFEGFTYLVLCLVLILGFSCVSIIINRKDSFYR